MEISDTVHKIYGQFEKVEYKRICKLQKKMKENLEEAIFEVTLDKNFPKLKKAISLWIQEAL